MNAPGQIPRARRIFEDALARDESERDAFLHGACGNDAELLGVVESLLKIDRDAEDSKSGFLTPPRPFFELELPPGTRIGKYQLERRIGSGGMGAVYEATQDHPRRKVAVKLLRSGIVSEETSRRFLYESEFLARLDHPSVAHVYEAGVQDAISYFAMEYIDNGRPVTNYAVDEKLDISAKVKIMAVVCDAVHHGHQKGIVHRDLKPANILVDRAGRVKIIDFGIAHATAAGAASDELQTKAGELLGTLQYMSPEQLSGGAGDVDTRVDVYALGVVLFELLTGRRPFSIEGRTLPDAIRYLSEATAPDARSVEPRVSAELNWILQKALERDRERRYDSASELAAELRRWLAGERVAAGPPGTAYRVRVFVRKNRAALAAAAIIFISLLAGVAGLWRGLVEAKNATNLALEKAKQQEAMFHFVRDMFTPDNPGEDEEGQTLEQRLDAAIAALDSAFPKQPEIVATMRATIGSVYSAIGLQNRAEPQLRIAYDQLRAARGDGDAETVRAASQLAGILRSKGRFGEAADLYRIAWENAVKTTTPDSERSRGLLAILTAMLEGGGRWSDAEICQNQFIEAQVKSSGAISYVAVRARTSRASFLTYLGRWREAAADMRELLDLLIANNLGEDRRALDCRRQLGRAMLSGDDAAAADDVLEKLFADQKQFQQKNINLRLSHFEVTHGEWLVARGKSKEALPMLKRAFEQLQKPRGGQQAVVAALVYARCLRIEGFREEAETTLLKAADKAHTLTGDSHPTTLQALLELAQLRAELGKTAEAIELLTTVEARARQAGGGACPLALAARESLAKLPK
ncbi:MAG: serine/threonine protein kinase [Planctomycetes bacterium]|nr:serine/threonine protein kinase [Planctomycetota bacterium]